MMLEATTAHRKRGPHKGEGGRRKMPLYNDPHKEIIATIFWMRKGHAAAGHKPFVEAAIINLLSGHARDNKGEIVVRSDVDVVADYRMTAARRNGPNVKKGMPLVQVAGIVNRTPPTEPDRRSNTPGESKPRAPGRCSEMKSLVETIQLKLDKHNRLKRRKDIEFLMQSYCALDFLFSGKIEVAAFLFRSAGWDLPNEVITRLKAALRAAAGLPIL